MMPCSNSPAHAVEQLDHFDKLLHRSGKPVEFSYNQNIALADVGERAGEFRSISLGT
jgi:hypothetical protein